MSQKSETIAVVSPFSATVSLFCDSVDRALHIITFASGNYSPPLRECIDPIKRLTPQPTRVKGGVWVKSTVLPELCGRLTDLNACKCLLKGRLCQMYLTHRTLADQTLTI